MEGGGRWGSRAFKDSNLRTSETNLWLIFFFFLVDSLVTFFLDSGSGGVFPPFLSLFAPCTCKCD